MYCCQNCFNSRYLHEIIQSDPRTGNCDFCNSVGVSIYEPRELLPFFNNILALYQVDDESETDIIQLIEKDFEKGIFSDKVNDKKSLLRAISEPEIMTLVNLLDKNVSSILERQNQIAKSERIHTIWEHFKHEIKNVNRFHIKNAIDLEKLKLFFENEAFHSKIRRGKIFYRSRISNKEGFNISEMGPPPSELATSGRANPKGISYLYVSDEKLTSIYEARATLFDYVSIAEFRLEDDLRVLNLRQPIYDPISWAEQEAIDDYLIYIPFIKTLQLELSLPIRSRDKEIDYLPTQYLSEFIKSLGFDGVEFQSSLRKEGYNIAIFNTEKLSGIGVKVYEISEITMNHTELN